MNHTSTLKPLDSVLIKPAGPDCNMSCKYCFYLTKRDLFTAPGPHRMTESILRETVRQVMEQGGERVGFGWQGGEPTLTGMDFYEKAVEFQHQYARPGQHAENGFQTNGVLIDRVWAEFFRENRFLVGLSLDGPQDVHDRYRLSEGGLSGWRQTVRVRDILLATGVDVNVLSVVNDHSVRFVRDIYAFHKSGGVYNLQFIPCVEPDLLHPERPAPYSVPPESYGRFLCDLFDLWKSDFREGRPTVFVRWFDAVFFTYVDLSAPECTLLPECGVYLVVEHDGGVYPCDFFVDANHRLGSVTKNRLSDLLNSEGMNRFGKRKHEAVLGCGTCPWLKHCWGGCPKERIGAGLCAAYRLFFEHADGDFRRLARDWREKAGLIMP